MTEATRTTRTGLRFGQRVELRICPACIGHGAKQIDDGLRPDGRPEQVRDLRGAAKVRARRLGLSESDIWPCVECGGEGWR